MLKQPQIYGTVATGFEPVERAFAENFSKRGEVGANVCIYMEGKPVVDLWGGWRNQPCSLPWERNTIVCMMSVSKGITALCLWMLIDRGQAALDANVCEYWPEFAKNGKEGITIDDLLSHKAGIFYFDLEPPTTCFDWAAAIRALESQQPAFEPGTKGGYHTTTYGHLVGEVVRRISGKTPGQFFRDEIAEKLSLDYWIGLPVTELYRVADTFDNPEDNSMAFLLDPTNKQGRQFVGAPKIPDLFNSEIFRTGEWPAINGHGNGRAMARLFGALAVGGELDNVRLLRPETVRQASEVQWNCACWMTGNNMRVGRGFLRPRDDTIPMGPNDETFATAGAGGSVGLADPVARIGFGYSPNYRCAFGTLGDRYEALINAAYNCV